MSAPEHRAIRTGQVAGTALLYAVLAFMAATIEVLLVPIRAGTAVLPVSVALAAATMIALPMLAAAGNGRLLAAAAPVGVWILTVVLLSQARPEGDVLLLGSSPLVYVTYAMLGIGAVCGIATVLSVDRGRGSARAADRLPIGRASTTAVPPARTPRR